MTLEKPSPQIQALSLVLWFQNEGGWIPQKEGSFSLNPPRTSQNPPEPPRPPGQDERTSPGRHRDDAVPAAGLKPADLAVVQVHRALVEASQSCGEWRFWGAKGNSFESTGWGFDECGFGSEVTHRAWHFGPSSFLSDRKHAREGAFWKRGVPGLQPCSSWCWHF